MAVASLQCYPLLNSPPVSVSRSISVKTPARRRAVGARWRLQRCCCSQSAESRSQDSQPQLERLFSNVNQATMKHEPGSVTGSIFLVAGTTVGAGILAIPAVTQEAGFLASAVTCIFCWIYMVVASGNIQLSSLLETNFAAAPKSIPIIALSFVYQNVVPVLCTNLEGDLSKVRKAIVLGTAIPLALFLIWDAVILGTIPGLAGSGAVTDPLEQLRSSNGIVGPIVEAFSFLAIGTSYIGFVLGLSDFIADLLKLPSGQNKPLTYLVTLLPPLFLSLLDPEIFFKALDFAGTYGVLVLFGVFPAAMSWSERYSDGLEAPVPPIVPGGKFTLSFVMGGALIVIFSEIFKDIMQLQGLH